MRRGWGPLALVLALGAAAAFAQVRPEDELFRQVKIDVFDEDWPAVLSGCEAILGRFPAGTTAPRAAFYRAVALSHLPGREAEALKAYRQFIARHPGETVMIEQAWSGAIDVACARGRAGGPDCAGLLREALAAPSDYVSTLAAIRAADTADADLRRRALAVLRRAHAAQSDTEIRNQILIAIFKIDPRQVPQMPEPAASPSPSRPGGSREPSLIRMTVFNKVEKRYDVKVNVPVAFARMLLDALGEARREELKQEARQQGIDLDDIFETIRRSGAGRLLEFEDDGSRVEIWIE